MARPPAIPSIEPRMVARSKPSSSSLEMLTFMVGWCVGSEVWMPMWCGGYIPSDSDSDSDVPARITRGRSKVIAGGRRKRCLVLSP